MDHIRQNDYEGGQDAITYLTLYEESFPMSPLQDCQTGQTAGQKVPNVDVGGLMIAIEEAVQAEERNIARTELRLAQVTLQRAKALATGVDMSVVTGSKKHERESSRLCVELEGMPGTCDLPMAAKQYVVNTWV